MENRRGIVNKKMISPLQPHSTRGIGGRSKEGGDLPEFLRQWRWGLGERKPGKDHRQGRQWDDGVPGEFMG
ncbi:MAG: hypothetical protein JEZ12_07465 [Desulfobacterium sp.]|nr:hypothetical protein [Desulfobacterium sp.]